MAFIPDSARQYSGSTPQPISGHEQHGYPHSRLLDSMNRSHVSPPYARIT